MRDIKVFGVPSTLCWIIFIVAQVSIMAFMVATLAVEQWVKLDPDDLENYAFEGGILSITDGLGEIMNPFVPGATVDVSDTIYAKLSCSSEFVLEIFGSRAAAGDFNWYLFKSWHTLFKDLWFSGGLFLVFELSALLSIIVIIATLTLLIFNKYYLHLNFCAAGCMWASHLVAIIGWLGLNSITFEDDCDELTDGTDPPTLCVMTGPKLGIFVLIYTTFIMIPYFIVIFVYSTKLSKHERESIGDGTKRVISSNEDQAKLNY